MSNPSAFIAQYKDVSYVPGLIYVVLEIEPRTCSLDKHPNLTEPHPQSKR